MFHRIAYTLLCFALFACNSTKKSQNNDSNVTCIQEIMVKDFSGLDGCGLLLVLPNGQKWMIAEDLTNTEFQPEKSYLIGYEIVEDMMSICMTENAAVRVTCVEVLPSEKAVCFDESSPFAIPWLAPKMDKWKPQRIIKYGYADQFVYKIDRPQGSLLMHCDGRTLCPSEAADWKVCYSSYQNNFGKGNIIFQAEGQID